MGGIDIKTLAATLGLTGGAAQEANQAAADAETAAARANSAASGAEAYAETYEHIVTALNMAYTGMQAELRDVQNRLATAEAQLAAIP